MLHLKLQTAGCPASCSVLEDRRLEGLRRNKIHWGLFKGLSVEALKRETSWYLVPAGHGACRAICRVIHIGSVEPTAVYIRGDACHICSIALRYPGKQSDIGAPVSESCWPAFPRFVSRKEWCMNSRELTIVYTHVIPPGPDSHGIS